MTQKSSTTESPRLILKDKILSSRLNSNQQGKRSEESTKEVFGAQKGGRVCWVPFPSKTHHQEDKPIENVSRLLSL